MERNTAVRRVNRMHCPHGRDRSFHHPIALQYWAETRSLRDGLEMGCDRELRHGRFVVFSSNLPDARGWAHEAGC